MKSQNGNGANLGFEQKLWLAADKLRSNMDAAEYKHVVLGLIFLKYISDAFNEIYEKLKKDSTSDPEDVDEYIAKRVFWVPKKARWDYLANNAKKPEIGKIIDDAMDAIEKDNSSLKGVLQKNYARPGLNKQRLGELIDLIGTIGLGDRENRNKDILGRVYEYFLGQFADAEGKKGGQFYTPRSIVKILVEILEPYKGRIFDPCCGSGGMFVQSEKFIEAHGGKIGDISIYGQESNQTTWRLCKMNLAMRGIESDMVKWNGQGSFLNDEHKDLRADFILANPPFNDSDWGGDVLQDDSRWKFGIPPKNNANFAWVQHIISRLSPIGIAGFVLANASLSVTRSSEKEIRKQLIENDLVDCIVILPKQLFYNTMIPACLWIVSRNRSDNKFRDRRKKILFIDARKMGRLIDRRHKELNDDEIKEIADIYHKWRNKKGNYQDIKEYCIEADIEDIGKHGYDLTPIRYIKMNLPKDYKEDLVGKMVEVSNNLKSRAIEFKKLEQEVRGNLSSLGMKNFADVPFSFASNISIYEFVTNLFNDWFIKFEFPDAKGKPYKSNGGIFEYSEDLEQDIPKGWQVVPISKVVKIVDCMHIKKPDLVESNNIILQFYNVVQYGLLDLSQIYTVSNEDYKLWTKNIVVREGDCILTNAGRTGAPAQIPHGLTASIGRNLTSLRPDGISPYYLIHYLLSDHGQKQIRKNLDIGTIFDSLNVKGVKKFVILLPNKETIEKFDLIVKPLRRIMEKNAYENFTPLRENPEYDMIEG